MGCHWSWAWCKRRTLMVAPHLTSQTNWWLLFNNSGPFENKMMVSCLEYFWKMDYCIKNDEDWWIGNSKIIYHWVFKIYIKYMKESAFRNRIQFGKYKVILYSHLNLCKVFWKLYAWRIGSNIYLNIYSLNLELF